MNKQPKKMAVFELLQRHNQPLSMPEILSELGAEYSERTVRRWLSEMVSVHEVEKSGQKRGTRYSIPSNPNETNVFSERSTAAIKYVTQPIFQRKPVAYNAKWLSNYQPNVSSYLSENEKSLLLQFGERTAGAAGTYARQIYNRLLVDLSYNSSRLEGNTYSLLETKQLLIDGQDTPGKLDEEKIMILNHKEALRYLVEKAENISINSETICTLHYLLSDALVPPKYAGKYRDHGVRIGGSTYIPFENTQQLQQQMEKICIKAKEIHNPYEQSIFLLAHISYLQAFIDVNKRTARLIANAPLIKNNLVPLSFNDMDKNTYISAMISAYELNDIQPLIDIYIFSYQRTCEQYDVTLDAMGVDIKRAQYREQRRNILRHIIIEKLTGKKMRTYITKHVRQYIPIEDQTSVEKNIKEDILNISSSSIVGLGVTKTQLNNWLKKKAL
jgi:fido (protein-threonine AMPylation protein)